MTTPNELELRTRTALSAIRESYGTEAGEFGADLFVAHHLDQLPHSFWSEHLNCETPDAGQVLSLLILRSNTGEDDENGLDVLDFTLPDQVTDYVLSVSFDASGSVIAIDMES